MEFVESAGNPVPHFGLWEDAGLVNSKTSSSALSYDTWYHMALTYNGTTMKGYINGSEVVSKSVTFSSPHNHSNTNHYMVWGAGDVTNMGDGSFFNGSMNEIRLYADALSATDILQNFNTNKADYGY